MGHIRGLEHSLSFLQNDFEPKYEMLKEKSDAIKQLTDAAKKATTIYLAADKDFEGEQIAYSVCILLKKDPKTTKRITFSEITEKAIKYAVENPSTINMNRVKTQQCRALMDLLIGFTISPLLWKHVAPALSAGRCQTPALRLVVEREDKIDQFQEESSYVLRAEWMDNTLFLHSVMTDELEDEESVKNYMEIYHNVTEGTVISNKVKPWSESAPKPFMTSTLQQQVSALYHLPPKRTMQIAQKLYEAGHITYMRTDSEELSQDAKQDATKQVIEIYGEEYAMDFKEESKEESKDGSKDDFGDFCEKSHEAIRPTHMELQRLEGVTSQEENVYRLIWLRTIQSVMSPARGEHCKIMIKIKGDEDFTWLSQQKRTIFHGWKCVTKIADIDASDAVDEVEDKEPEDKEPEDKEPANKWEKIIKLQPGHQLHWKEMRGEQKETKAQGRFTEATLVRELERHGIGRPSTFAALLAVIQEKNYAEIRTIPPREVDVIELILSPNVWPCKEKHLKKKVGQEKNKLVPTALGRSILSFLLIHFDDLFAYKFTQQMEKSLDEIADGTLKDWKSVIKSLWESYKERHATLNVKSEIGSSNKVKEFTGGLKAVQTKKGPLLLRESKDGKGATEFFGWPLNTTFEEITEVHAIEFIGKKDADIQLLVEHGGTPIYKKKGKFGEYLQWGMISVPFIEGEECQLTIERLEAKRQQQDSKVIFKGYEIRDGQYGPYIMKLQSSNKKPECVSLPKGIDAKKLTEKEIEGIYKLGLEAKKAAKGFNKKK
jgi:DNA topoisomerase-1